MDKKHVDELRAVLDDLRGTKGSIHRITEPRFAAGTKKSQSWFRKLSAIEADIAGELARAEIMAEVPSTKRKKVAE